MSTTPSHLPRSIRPRARSLPLLSVLPFLTLGWTVGCGDDEPEQTFPEAGKGGASSAGRGGTSGTGTGGRAGSAGSGGEAGEETGGTSGGGSSGDGGSSGSGEGGEGGDSVAGAGGDDGGTGGTTAGTGGSSGDAGAGGEGGNDPGPETFAAITKLRDTLITTAHELRGLVYARSGKVYASGHFGSEDPNNVLTTTDREVAIARFNADGTADTTFGTDGVVRYNLVTRVVDSSGTSPVIVNSGDEGAWGIVELADNNFLLQVNLRDATGKGVDVALLKVDAAGARVAGFGDNGLKRVDFGWVDETDNASWPTTVTNPAAPTDQAWGLQLDTSEVGTEKVVVFGHGSAKVGSMTTGNSPVARTDNDRYITRLLTADGSRDPDFNVTGAPYTVNSGGTFGDNGRRGIVLPDGTIYAGGYTNFGAGLENHVMVLKLTPAGLPDASFRHGIALPGISRTNGFVNDGGAAECYGLALLSNGLIVTTGYGGATAPNVISSLGWETTTAPDMVSFALLASGAPDTSWGNAGTLAIQSEALAGRPDAEERGRDMVVLSDDRAVHAGRFGGNPALFVVKKNGELDASSDLDGRFEYEPLAISPAATSHFFAVAKSTDGRSLVASTNNHGNGVRVAFLTVAAE